MRDSTNFIVNSVNACPIDDVPKELDTGLEKLALRKVGLKP